MRDEDIWTRRNNNPAFVAPEDFCNGLLGHPVEFFARGVGGAFVARRSQGEL